MKKFLCFVIMTVSHAVFTMEESISNPLVSVLSFEYSNYPINNQKSINNQKPIVMYLDQKGILTSSESRIGYWLRDEHLQKIQQAWLSIFGSKVPHDYIMQTKVQQDNNSWIRLLIKFDNIRHEVLMANAIDDIRQDRKAVMPPVMLNNYIKKIDDTCKIKVVDRCNVPFERYTHARLEKSTIVVDGNKSHSEEGVIYQGNIQVGGGIVQMMQSSIGKSDSKKKCIAALKFPDKALIFLRVKMVQQVEVMAEQFKEPDKEDVDFVIENKRKELHGSDCNKPKTWLRPFLFGIGSCGLVALFVYFCHKNGYISMNFATV